MTTYPTTARLQLPLVPDADTSWGPAMRAAMETLDAAVPWKGRRHAVATTPTLQFYERCELDVTFNESCEMVSVLTDHPCWICVYGSAAARAKDAARLYSQAPVAGEGCMGEVSTYRPDHLQNDWSPSPMFHNSDAAVAPTAYLSVRNMEPGYTGSINLDFLNLPQEQFTPSGPQGDTGLPGRTLLVGTVPPTSANGQDGDSYIYKVYTGPDLTDLIYYGQKTAGAWPAGFSLKGPPGSPGVDGNTILTGTVDPTPGMGLDGNYYINKVSWVIFGPKTAGAWPAGTSLVGPPGSGGGKVVNEVISLDSSVVSGTLQIPNDNTKPQITEGFLYLTVNYTPTNAANILIVEAMANVYCGIQTGMILTIFIGAGPDADGIGVRVSTVYGDQLKAAARKVAGTISPIAITLRLGTLGSAQTIYTNRTNSGATLGGVFSSFIKVSEVQP